MKYCNGKEQYMIIKPIMHLVLFKIAGWSSYVDLKHHRNSDQKNNDFEAR